MMIAIRIAAALGVAVAPLAGCSEAAPDAPDAMTADPAAKTGQGTGTVTAVDPAGGRITLDHQAIPEVGWPAMTMTFAADPPLLAGVRRGDRVAFDLAVSHGNGVITALAVQ